MTNREKCEKAIKEGGYAGISAYNAQLWLNNHPILTMYKSSYDKQMKGVSITRKTLIDSDIQTLVEVMKEKLAENDHKVPWDDIPNRELFTLLDDEVSELSDAILHGTPREIMRETADVANLAMMLAGNAGRKA